MDIGVSSACFYPEVVTENTVDICRNMGVGLMEFFLESPFECKPEYCEKLKEKCLENNVTVNSIHAFAGSFEPFLFDTYPRRAGDMYDIFKNVCNAGRILGAKSYVFHGLSWYGTEQRTDYREIAGSMDMLADTAQEYGVALAWENVFWCRSRDPEFIERVLQYTKSDNLKFTLDVKQARKSGFTPQDYLKVYKDRLVNVHISDSNIEDSCLLPGRGSVDFKDLFSLLKSYGYTGNFIIEVYRNNYSQHTEIGDSANLLRKLFDI